MRPARLSAVGALLAVLGLLAGCAQIPRTGPVMAGAVGNPDPREGLVQFIPEGPQPDAAPGDLVLGFIRAAAGFSDDHLVARRFLADRSRLTWKPDARVQVFGGEQELTVRTSVDGDVAEVSVRAPVRVRLDGDGRYTATKPGTRVTARYRLMRVGGQWRIAQLDDGILIAQTDFDATFRPFPVYFADPLGSYLIPDVHWFAGTRDLSGSPEIPTALVRELLEGPPGWLQGAVTTGAPAGTAMALGAVVVADEVADVDLNGTALNADATQRRMLAGQLRATLGQLRPIVSVKITVRQAEYDTSSDVDVHSGVGGEAREPWLQEDPQVGDQALVVDDRGRLAWLTGRSTAPVEHVDGLRFAGVNRPAVSADRTTFAALDASRGRLLMQTQGTGKAVLVSRAVGLSAPSFDPRGWVWTGPAANRGVVYAGRTGAPTVRVKARWLDGDELVGLRLSRDGARALVSVRTRGRGHVFVAGVLRGPGGRPTTLTQPIGLIPDLTDVQDAAWVDEDQVAVLGRRAGGTQQVWLAQIGGPVTGKGSVPGASTVTAGDGESSLSVGTAAGTYSFLRGWRRASSGRWPAYPG